MSPLTRYCSLSARGNTRKSKKREANVSNDVQNTAKYRKLLCQHTDEPERNMGTSSIILAKTPQKELESKETVNDTIFVVQDSSPVELFCGSSAPAVRDSCG